MKKVIVYILLFVPLLSFSQKVSDELLKVRNAYLKAENFSADVEVTGYKNKLSTSVISIGKGMLRKTPNAYYSKFGTDEMISNKNCTVIIDHYEKNITWFSKAKIAAKDLQNMPNIDSLLKLNDSVVYKGIESGFKKISFYKKNADVKQTDIFIEANTYFIAKIIYTYKDSDEENNYEMNKVVIVYKNITTKKINEEVFSEKKYVTQGKNKPQLTQAYKKYKLIVAPNEKL